MTRYNLWVTTGGHSRVICYGDRDTLNTIALTAGVEGSVHVLPDNLEPSSPEATLCEVS
jgi:hypothetical protein